MSSKGLALSGRCPIAPTPENERRHREPGHIPLTGPTTLDGRPARWSDTPRDGPPLAGPANGWRGRRGRGKRGNPFTSSTYPKIIPAAFSPTWCVKGSYARVKWCRHLPLRPRRLLSDWMPPVVACPGCRPAETKGPGGYEIDQTYPGILHGGYLSL
jgi:hypothetical protein